MIPEFMLIQKFLLTALAGCGICAGTQTFMLTKKSKKLATSKLINKKALKKLIGNNGLYISKNFQLSLLKSFEGIIVIGPPGEGKTTNYFIPNCLNIDLPKKSSLIIPDPKGELYKLTSSFQKQQGRKVIQFEPLGNSSKYNLLENCNDFTEVSELAQTLIQNGDLAISMATGKSGSGADWINMAKPLFTAALLYCKDLGYPYNNVTNALRLILNNSDEELTIKFAECNNNNVKEQFAIYQTCMESNKTASSIKITLATALQLFTDTNLSKATLKSDFKPTDLRHQPIALYIKYNENRSNYLMPFLSAFYGQLLNQIMNDYEEGKTNPIICLMDEFQNLGRISNITEVSAVCRSREISLSACVQNISKLHQIYGKENTATLLNNFKTKCILPSLSDLEALKYLSELAGDTEIEIVYDEEHKSKQTRKLFTCEEIKDLEDGKVLIMAHNKRPFLDKQNRWFEQEKFKQRVRGI